jgi:pyridoxamine 5'-phosphate oxidase
VSDSYLAPRLPDDLPNDPMHWVDAWLIDAADKAVKRNPNSMAIITSGSDAKPSARMVLCKDFHADPGYLVFYTNYNSNKARQIDENSNVAVLIHWDQLGRQVRIEGQAVRSPEAESDTYFASRDWGSQIGAWGSDQSAPLESRNALIAQVAKRALKLGVNVAKNLQSIIGSDQPTISRPPHWGGYRVWASRVELWIEGKDRIHDRARWERTLTRQDDDSFVVGEWSGNRLQP